MILAKVILTALLILLVTQWVNVSDLLAVIDAWGSDDQVADINADGIVNVGDLLEVVGSWGACQ